MVEYPVCTGNGLPCWLSRGAWVSLLRCGVMMGEYPGYSPGEGSGGCEIWLYLYSDGFFCSMGLISFRNCGTCPKTSSSSSRRATKAHPPANRATKSGKTKFGFRGGGGGMSGGGTEDESPRRSDALRMAGAHRVSNIGDWRKVRSCDGLYTRKTSPSPPTRTQNYKSPEMTDYWLQQI